MPADFIIKTGDMIQITIPPPAIVPMLMAPIPLIGTSMDLCESMPICLQGDEHPPTIKGPMPYTAPPFVTPGVGTVTIIVLPTNLTVLTTNGKPILIKGATFQAIFNVSAPAMQPTPGGPVPDPLLVKTGTAQFITTTVLEKAG